MNKITWVLLVLIAFFELSCRKRALTKADEPQKMKVRIKKKVDAQAATFNYLSTKSKIEYTNGIDNFSSNATFRIRKDSVIWVSVNPVLGIEVVRCLINRDSVFIVNKYQKEYYAYSFKSLSEKLNFELNYDLVQSIIFGNLPFAATDEDSVTTDSLYSLIDQKRKTIAIQNYIKTGTRKLEKLIIKDLSNSNSLDINYENFLQIEDILFAFANKISLSYRVKNEFQNLYVGIEHHKLETTNKDLKFPFNIPNKYIKK